MFDIAVDRLHV